MSLTDWDRAPQLSALAADACRLAVIHSLLEKIEGVSPVLVGDALDSVRDRLRRDGSHHEIEMRRTTSCNRDLARGVAHLAGVDSDLAEEVFLPSRAGLVVEELRDFCRQHRIGGAR